MVTYKDNAELYEQVEDIPGEQALFDQAAEIMTAYAKAQKRGISALDLCCGTAPIVRRLALDDNSLFAKITGVDISQEYLDFAEEKCEEVTDDAHVLYYGTGTEVEFVRADAAEYKHAKQVDLVLASSAYHHMDNGTSIVHNPKKQEFLENIAGHLKDTGIVVFCENFVRDYQDDHGYLQATRKFYEKRIEQLRRMGITDQRIDLLIQVMQYGLNKEYELKASKRIFLEDITKTGFDVTEQHKVWPQENLFDDDAVGDFVIVAKKK